MVSAAACDWAKLNQLAPIKRDNGMNLGFASDDFALVFIAFLSLMFLIPLTFAIASLLTRLVARLLDIERDRLNLIILLGVAPAVFFTGVIGLNRTGETRTGRVTEKSEQVAIRIQGDWRYTFETGIEYPAAGAVAHTSLFLPERQYDSLAVGDAAELRVVPLYRTISLVRLTSFGIGDILPLPLLVLGLILALLGWRLFRLSRNVGWIFALLVIAIGGVGLPLLSTIRDSQAAGDLAARPRRATARVERITRIERIDYFPCDSECDNDMETEFEVPQQYDIVELRYTPDGRREAVTAVASADAGSLDRLELGGSVEIAYNPGTPRDVQLIGATHSHHWRNAFYFARSALAVLVGISLFFLAWAVISRRMRRRLLTGRTPVRSG